jgi:tetratricopeptide (TPR) repeat protein
MAEAHRDEIAKLEALYASNPGGRVFTHLAEAYRKAGDADRAREILSEGMKKHPDSASAFVVLGRVLTDRGDLEEGFNAFHRALELDTGNLVALRWCGDLAMRIGRVDDALGFYHELIARDPSDDSLRERVGIIEADRAVAMSSDAPSAAPQPNGVPEERAYDAPAAAAESMLGYGAVSGDFSISHDAHDSPEEYDPSDLPGDLAAFAGRQIESRTGKEWSPQINEADAAQQAEDEALFGSSAEADAPALLDFPIDSDFGMSAPAEQGSETADLDLGGTMDLGRFDPAGADADVDVFAPATDDHTWTPAEAGADEASGALKASDAGAAPDDAHGSEAAAFQGEAVETGSAEPLFDEFALHIDTVEDSASAESSLEDNALEAIGLEENALEGNALEDNGLETGGFGDAIGGEPTEGAGAAFGSGDVVSAPLSDDTPDDDMAVAGLGAVATPVTETMAELYRNQGFPERAADVYRQLIRERGGDARLEERLAEIEGSLAPTIESASHAGEATEPSVVEGLVFEEDASGEMWLRDAESPWTAAEPGGADHMSPYDMASEPEDSVAAAPPIASYFQSLLQWRPASGSPAGMASNGSSATTPDTMEEDVLVLGESDETPDMGVADDADNVPESTSDLPWLSDPAPSSHAMQANAAAATEPADLMPWESSAPAEAPMPWETPAPAVPPAAAASEASPAALPEPPMMPMSSTGSAMPGADATTSSAGASDVTSDEELMPWETAPAASMAAPETELAATADNDDGAAGAEGEDDEDLEMFRSWLQSLKK